MSKQAFNTEKMTDLMNKLNDYNQEIDDKFENLKKSINQMLDSWSCSSINVVEEAFSSLKEKSVARYKKQKKIINSLKKIIPDYIETEEENKNLRDKFK